MSHSTIEQRLLQIDEQSEAHLEIGKEMTSAYGGALYPMDLLAVGALNRSVAHIAGFKVLIKERNMICAGALLRLQLDTALRFYAAFLVDEPHKFATDVLGGKQIRKIKDRAGKRMQDYYLVSRLSQEYEWVSRVYEKTSGYVHFSSTHLMSAISVDGKEEGTFQMKVSAIDKELPDHIYLEAVDAFAAATEILLTYIRGWVFTKDSPDYVQQLRKGAATDADA